LKVANVDENRRKETGRAGVERVPRPTAHFRRRAWLEFQRAIDPLAPPKPLKPPRQN
jgi:hypothetical protein